MFFARLDSFFLRAERELDEVTARRCLPYFPKIGIDNLLNHHIAAKGRPISDQQNGRVPADVDRATNRIGVIQYVGGVASRDSSVFS